MCNTKDCDCGEAQGLVIKGQKIRREEWGESYICCVTLCTVRNFTMLYFFKNN